MTGIDFHDRPGGLGAAFGGSPRKSDVDEEIASG
jgi:hypothetical protein